MIIRTSAGGVGFVGTDHVFRLHGTRVEAFSGIATSLYRMLRDGDIDRYRETAPEQTARWTSHIRHWEDGPASIQEDGSIMAMRALPER
jgi:hypothetical protein